MGNWGGVALPVLVIKAVFGLFQQFPLKQSRNSWDKVNTLLICVLLSNVIRGVKISPKAIHFHLIPNYRSINASYLSFFYDY